MAITWLARISNVFNRIEQSGTYDREDGTFCLAISLPYKIHSNTEQILGI